MVLTTADPLVWQLAAPRGRGQGQGTVYEDDGESLDFRGDSSRGGFPTAAVATAAAATTTDDGASSSGATTTLSYSSTSRTTLDVTVGATNGSAASLADLRALRHLREDELRAVPAIAAGDVSALLTCIHDKLGHHEEF